MLTTPTVSQTDLFVLEQQLAALIERIPQLDETAMQAARERQAQLTKPAGALGRLETLAIQLAGITGEATPQLTRKAILIAAADHGVCIEGVSPYPQAVTAQMVGNFLAGGAAINVMARNVGARVTVLDLGVAHPLPVDGQAVSRAMGDSGQKRDTRFVSRPLGHGTGNLARGPAMTQAQAVQALLVGAATVQEEIAQGLDVLGLGEMGIGNSTAAAAVACALTGAEPARMVGRGAGLDDLGLIHKIAVVQQALIVNDLVANELTVSDGLVTEGAGNARDAQVEARDAPLHAGDLRFGLRVLSSVGGFELAGLAGAILATAANRIPVLVDGFIATASAMLATQIAPSVRPFLIAAHRSAEPGHAQMLAWLKLEPYLALDMRLGEGTGAALGMSLVDAAWQTLGQMATFAEAGIAGKVAETEEDSSLDRKSGRNARVYEASS